MTAHAALEAAILADLADDGPREVYADRLQEAGDPRGEAIMLSLLEAKGTATVKQRSRLRGLLKTHRAVWFGELDGMSQGITLHRGFLSSIKFKRRIEDATPAELSRLLDNPELRFVEEVRSASPYGRIDPAIRLAPMFTSLREIEFPMGSVAGALAVCHDRHPRSWRVLHGDTPLARAEVLEAAVESPSLRRVEKISIQVWPRELEAFVAYARRLGWPSPDSVLELELRLGAGFAAAPARREQLRAMGVHELARTVTW